MPKETQRGAIQPFIVIMQIATMIYFSKLGISEERPDRGLSLAAPATIIGTWIGLALFRAVDDRLFRRLVLIFLLVSGIILAL